MSQNRFHHFSIGFTQLSNLFQPFAIGFNQLSNHVQPISLFFSLVFSSCSTYCNILPYRLSSVVQSISLVWASAFISFFFPVLGTILKGVLCSTNTLRELDLTSYPFWMVLWQLSSCSSMQFYFSIIHFSRKWPSRMTNLSRQVYIYKLYTHLLIRPKSISSL